MLEIIITTALIVMTIGYIFSIYGMFCVIYNKERPSKIIFPLIGFSIVNLFFLFFVSLGHIALGHAFTIVGLYWAIAMGVSMWYMLMIEE